MPAGKKKKLNLTNIVEAIQGNNESGSESEPDIAHLIEEARYQQSLSEIQLLASTVRRAMLEIAQLKERNKERRHQELMTVLKDSFTYNPTPLDNVRPECVGNANSNTKTPPTHEAANSEEMHEIFMGETDSMPTTGSADIVEYVGNETCDFVQSSYSAPSSTMGSHLRLPPPHSVKADIREEYRLMRQKMIKTQMQKMADRLRKNREQEQN